MSLDKTSVRIILRMGKRFEANGTFPVKLRVTHQRKYKEYAVQKLRYSDEDFKKIVNPKSQGNNKKIRKQFEAIEQKAKNAIDKLPEFTFEDFESEFIGKTKAKQLSISEYFENKARELESNGKLQTAILYRATIKSLKRFDSKVTFKKITPKFLQDYENWFVKEGKTPQKKGAAPVGGSYTTVGIYLRNLKAILNMAISNGMPVKYPFGAKKGLYQPPTAKGTKRALNMPHIEKLYQYEPDTPQEAQALKLWLFSYMCNGINFADIANLKYENIKGQNIEFIRQKTKDTTKDKTAIKCYLHPQVKQIIQEIGNEPNPTNYIFPIYEQGLAEREKLNRLKQAIKNTNKYMNRIAEKLGFNENLTTYFARHSFATNLIKTGGSMEMAKESLGHSDPRTTQNYFAGFSDEQRAEFTANLIPGNK